MPDRLSLRKKVQRILKICSQEHADTYINARGGVALYDRAVFEQYGIRLLFNIPSPLEYRQLSPVFTPDLSVIDVLMNCGRQGTRALLDQYDLV